MASIELLDVRLHNQRVGTLSRLGDIVRFAADPEYVADQNRNTLSLSWSIPGMTQHKLMERDYIGNVAKAGKLPPFFANMLSESQALRRYISHQRGCSPADDFALLAACGDELPGAVTVSPVEHAPVEMLRQHTAMPDRVSLAHLEHPLLGGFSLAGAQLKAAMSAAENQRRCTFTAQIGDIPSIVKFAEATRPGLVKAEYAAMKLLAELDSNVAPCFEIEAKHIDLEGRPFPTPAEGTTAFVVRRFDRNGLSERIHTEDFCQMRALYPDEKYAPEVNAGYVMNLCRKIGGGQQEVEEVLRRVVGFILLGNTDAHRKNWSVIYPDSRTPILSPAYDVVPVSFFRDHAGFVLEKAHQSMTRKLLVGSAVSSGGLTEERANEVIGETIEKAFDRWPRLLAQLPVVMNGETTLSSWLNNRLNTLQLVRDYRPNMAQSVDAGNTLVLRPA